jgi:D-alanyl-D-alanine dipeptidase
MPSSYAEFGPRARHGSADAASDVGRNCGRLRAAMERAGFVPLEDEWWHYRDPDAREWPLLDIPFDEVIR